MDYFWPSTQFTVGGTDATDHGVIINPSTNKGRVKAIKLIPTLGVSTHASNYITATVKKGSTTIATRTTNSTGGSAIVLDTPEDLTISGSGTDLEIAAGGTLLVDVAKAGTGPAYEFIVMVTFEPVRE